MKKMLILALLFMGCESFGVFSHEHEGACVRRTTDYASNGSMYGSDGYTCYPNITEKDCITGEVHFQDSENIVYDYVYISCEEFCSQESGWECDTNSCENIEDC